MRLALSGGIPHPKYLAIKLQDNSTFLPRVFEKYGYTNFDVICIGAGGGNGGSFHNFSDGLPYRVMGGAGGGGGAHRIGGLLRALPKECPVQVGQGGLPGDSGQHPSEVTDGSSGGKTSFNDESCYASGGRGGHGPTFPYSDHIFDRDESAPSGAHGGQGGLGNRSDPGGGANGGSTNPDDYVQSPGMNNWQLPDPTEGVNGGYDQNTGIGAGGGGGAGGIGRGLLAPGDTRDTDGWTWDDSWTWDAPVEVYRRSSAGGIGSYAVNPGGTFIGVAEQDWVSCPGGYPARDKHLRVKILPGGGGGANAIDILELPLLAGRSFGETRAGEDGAVVIAVSFDD